MSPKVANSLTTLSGFTGSFAGSLGKTDCETTQVSIPQGDYTSKLTLVTLSSFESRFAVHFANVNAT
jgi:hypothetical protein